VGGLSWGFFYPSSWLGIIIHAPLGVPAFIFALGGILAVAAAVCETKGRPFFKRDRNVA